MNADMIHEELSKDIIGTAMSVLNALKPRLGLALLLNFKRAKLERKPLVRTAVKRKSAASA
jgi:hypothetical protein